MNFSRNEAFGGEKAVKPVKWNKERPSNMCGCATASILRLVPLDTLLFLLLLTFASLSWVHHVATHYLTKQIEAATWDAERDLTDQCYYFRYCNANDITTTNATDLYLSPEATPQDAYQHQLQHGFTVFPHVLTRETAANLRNFVISKNQNLTKEEEIWLISNQHRWSFPLGCEEQSVVQALKELAYNERLQETMELLLGDDPAMIELTAITSAFGAQHQEYHHDGRTSLGQYAQGISHAYSIFIMLQDTTPAMGATGACPGTAKCSEGLEQVCEEYGLQPQNSQGYWGAGDALVMNMDSWHRGSAHTDPNGAHRVMLCVTFTARPRDWGETRQLPQGISYSIRWDHYGFTWRDLQQAETTIVPPTKRVLKSLGLYKHPSQQHWGVDFSSSACMRIANEFMGFTRDDLEDFRKRGGFKLLPESLQGEGKSWQDFLMDTLRRCKEFVKQVSMCFIAGYLVLCSVGMVLCRRFTFWNLFGTVVRLGMICAVVLAMYAFAVQHVDKSQWALDLNNGLRYTSPFSFKELYEYTGPLAFPHRRDVLIATRFKSRYLFAYNDYIGSHPGNQVWNELIEDKLSVFASYSGLLPVFRQAIAEYIVSSVHEKSGRFLYQHPKSHWVEMSDEDVTEVTNDELTVKSNGILCIVIQELDFLLSDAKYGPLRFATMTDNDIFPYLLDLKDLLLKKPRHSLEDETLEGAVQYTAVSSKLPPLPKTLFSELHSCRVVSLPVGKAPSEPDPSAWLRSGDIVSARLGKRHYCKAKLKAVTSSGESIVKQYLKEGREQVSFRDLKRYIPPKVGEQVDVMVNGSFRAGVIVNKVVDGLYDVSLNDGGILENTSDDVFCRYSNATRIV